MNDSTQIHLASPRWVLGLAALALLTRAAAAAPQCPSDAFEPNDTCAQAALVSAGTHGGLSLDGDAPDHYRFDVPAGTEFTLDVNLTPTLPHHFAFLELFRDDGSASPCDSNENRIGLAFSEGSTNDFRLQWVSSSSSSQSFLLRMTAQPGSCTPYDLTLTLAPDACANQVDDAFEDNDTCASPLALGPGSYPGLFTGIGDPDYFLVTAQPGEFLAITLTAPAAIPVRLFATDVSASCSSNGTVAGGAFSSQGVPWTFHLANVGAAPASWVFEVLPDVVPTSQIGFCTTYSLELAVAFDPCGVMAGDAFEPNETYDAASPISASAQFLKIHAFEHDWYAIDVPAQSTLRVLSTSVPGFGPRPTMLFGLGGQQDFLASSNPLYFFDPIEHREWLQWSNPGASSAGTRMLVISPNSIGPDLPCDVYDLDLEFTLGTPFCPLAKNSTGEGARLSASGSTQVGVGTLDLSASNLPPNKFGLVFFGATEKPASVFGGGLLCLQGPLFRLPPGNSGPSGVLSTQVDWVGPDSVISAGQTWSFQAWFRDPTANSSFNLSEGLRVRFH